MNLMTLALTIIAAVAIDGDTIKADGTRYRLWGIDAVEMDEPGGRAARDALSGIIAGQPLACTQIDTDRYGRPVVRCTLPGGTDPACAMVAAGQAKDWPRYSGGHYRGCE